MSHPKKKIDIPGARELTPLEMNRMHFGAAPVAEKPKK